MNVTLCSPTLNRYDLLAELINSAVESSMKPTRISIVDNGGKFKEHFGDITEVDGIPLALLVPKSNYGVGRSWNYFLHKYEDYVVVCNDDITLEKNTLELLVKAAEQNPNELFFTPEGYWEHNWACFLQKKESLATIGEYDGNFYPAFFEDSDYKYRLKLAGYDINIVKGCHYKHANGGSNTSREPEFQNRFSKLFQYYLAKWGGTRNNEIFTRPFNFL